MSEGVQKEGAEFRSQAFRAEGRQGESLGKDDVVGPPDLGGAVLQVELEGRVRAAEMERGEIRERKERARQVTERYRQEDQEMQDRGIREEAWKYVAQKEAQERYGRKHPEIKHQQALKAINTQLSDLLAVQREQKQEFWSFLPGKRRAVAKLEEEIAELKTRARIERMRIADITNEHHADLKGKRTKEALKPFLDALKKPERQAPTKEDGHALADIARDLIRSLYREKASLQAEREGWSMLVRPFRRHAIETRLEEIGREMSNLQEEARKSARAV